MTLAQTFGTDIVTSGWGHTRFGSSRDQSLEDLVAAAARDAIAAGIDAGDVDEIWFGQFNSASDRSPSPRHCA
ncbi:hypothetical protein ABT147_33700 [Streptomyces sp. NPDC001868]|uniref:hypothetical protein n=1 Tax=Streptomyces sp. NPDC001868 TaxID=3154401 RepID=UPI00332D1DEF